MFLQSFVTPVYLYTVNDKQAHVEELIGSSFFINSNGLFITARHVIEYAEKKAQTEGYLLGVAVKDKHGTHKKSMIAKVKLKEFAPEPNDIAIGLVNYQCDPWFCLQDREVEVWQDVATYGYPLGAVSHNPENLLSLNIRCHKGYIQRLLRPGDIPFGPNPPSFELSFLLSRGLSGAPLFIHKRPKDIVIGVCVGSVKSETVEHESLEVDNDGRRYSEKKVSIEQYGLAHDLRPLYQWKPEVLGGKTLIEVATMNSQKSK